MQIVTPLRGNELKKGVVVVSCCEETIYNSYEVCTPPLLALLPDGHYGVTLPSRVGLGKKKGEPHATHWT
mgnify:CR=1 FL=1